jgi:hypothetical protein
MEAEITSEQIAAAGSGLMPCQVGVWCDNCGVTAEHDYLVREDSTPTERFEAARRHLRANEGWSCGPDGDFCPTCQGKVTVDDMIRECHGRFGETEHAPGLISAKRAALRLKLIADEVAELAVAVEVGDLVAIADALGDIEYALRGTAFAYGIPLDEVTDEIHKSNMTKDFTNAADEDAKLVKGPGYEPPHLAPILDAALRRFEDGDGLDEQ